MRPNALTVCVGYDDLLAVTLHRNAMHLGEVMVVTTPEDERTHAVVRSVPTAHMYVTDAFTRHGAAFNKGLAVEEALAALAPTDWTLIMDADVLLPTLGASAVPTGDSTAAHVQLDPECLYGRKRVILTHPESYYDDLDWSRSPVSQDPVPVGYFQLFHPAAAALRDRPWYDVTFAHAGGCDGAFAAKYGPTRHRWLDGAVIHLGPRDSNWFGRHTERLDGAAPPGADAARKLMAAYRSWKGWYGANRMPFLGAAPPEHVDVPGHRPTGFVVKSARKRSV